MSSETTFERPGVPFDEALKRALNTPPIPKKKLTKSKNEPKKQVA